jgi:hypothetical protein
MIIKKDLKKINEYKDHILGSMTYRGLLTTLKYTKSYLTTGNGLQSTTNQQWTSIEASACGVPVIHNGLLADYDFHRTIVLERPETNDALTEIVRFQKDELYRTRRAHKSWRDVHQNHTFSHRLRNICDAIGAAHTHDEYPEVTILCMVDQADKLQECLKTYDRQNYPNKSLIVIINGEDNTRINNNVSDIIKSRDDVDILKVPNENMFGTCLNFGYMIADGRYCFRIDEKDSYGAEYISDMMLNLKAVDADIIVKPSLSFQVEEEALINDLNSKIKPYITFLEKEDNKNKKWTKINPAGGKKQLFANIKGKDSHYQEEDITVQDIISNNRTVIISTDVFNIVKGGQASCVLRKTNQEKREKIGLGNIRKEEVLI